MPINSVIKAVFLLLVLIVPIQAKEWVVSAVPTQNKVIALTLDDGPNEKYTEKFLEILQREHIKGTFFLMGQHVERYPELALKIKKAGHEIGNHSHTHHRYDKMSKDEIKADLAKSQRAFYDVFHEFPLYFRPPYGALCPSDYDIFERYFFKVVAWNLDCFDWKKNFSANQIAQRVIDRAQPGSIVLMHDSNDKTLAALPKMIAGLRAKGYHFVTVSQLLDGELKDAQKKVR